MAAASTNGKRASTARRKAEPAAGPESAAAAGIITVSPPNYKVVQVEIIGTAPLMIHRFSKKAEMKAIHEAGGRTNEGRKDKPPRDFDADFEAAKYRERKAGWEGFNAASVRAALISACRTIGIKMTHMKLAAHVLEDGRDEDGTPLVRIHGDSVCDIRPARNSSGVIDLRARPRYDEWHATLRVRFDADMIAFRDLARLLMRAGGQVGIGEGRPDSRMSAGMGFGLFDVVGEMPK